MRVLTVIHQADAGPGVFSEVPGAVLVPWLADREPAPPLEDIDAALVLGAAANVEDASAKPLMDRVLGAVSSLLDRDLPTLGVCLGAQLVAKAAGGGVERAPEPEIGWYEVALTDAGVRDPLTDGLPPRFDSFQWHSWVASPPDDAEVLASSDRCLQAFRLADAPAWGIQFHAEVSSADAAHWTDEFENDPDAVAMGLDPAALHAENAQRMEAWHELGRGVFSRFLAAAADHRQVAES